ncbi:hypothetical protein T4E_2798 [Trichinella pseudospiralis]|uniref:CCHC-type domain-containing protein n=1 Tax=Trichinella pseudospiralis TaxID=6337 RepID=A0A0V0XF30_TRIPS|nr:hypothetical protein T4E_2798 [Trichinella pseudospiralis]
MITFTFTSAEDGGARALLGIMEGTGMPRDGTTVHPVLGRRVHQALQMSYSNGEGSPRRRTPDERSPKRTWAEGKIPSRVGTGPESDDNLQNFLEFVQLQADSLFPTGDLGLEESGRGKSSGATQNDSRRLKGRERDRVRSSAAALVTFVQCVCPFCEGDHDATSCKRFLDADHESRASLLREKGVCYKSLKTGHLARECRKGRQSPVLAPTAGQNHVVVKRGGAEQWEQRSLSSGRTSQRSSGSRGPMSVVASPPWEAVWGRSADGGESSFGLELLRAQTDQRQARR